jgi:hypothetical protein
MFRRSITLNHEIFAVPDAFGVGVVGYGFVLVDVELTFEGLNPF